MGQQLETKIEDVKKDVSQNVKKKFGSNLKSDSGSTVKKSFDRRKEKVEKSASKITTLESPKIILEIKEELKVKNFVIDEII